MLKVKTFGIELRPMKAMGEIKSLDDMVNSFIVENAIS